MANSYTYEVSRRLFCARIGSFTEGSGTTDSNGKWSLLRTINAIVPYTETTSVTVARSSTAAVAEATSTMSQYIVPLTAGEGSTSGATVDYESASTSRTMTRVSENGYYDLTTVELSSTAPGIQIPGVTTLVGYTAEDDDILVSNRTYNQAIGTVNVGYGTYDEKNATWQYHRNVTIVGRFRERVWERRALSSLPSGLTPRLYFDTYNYLYGPATKQSIASFDYEMQKTEFTYARTSPCGFHTLTILFKETLGITELAG